MPNPHTALFKAQQVVRSKRHSRTLPASFANFAPLIEVEEGEDEEERPAQPQERPIACPGPVSPADGRAEGQVEEEECAKADWLQHRTLQAEGRVGELAAKPRPKVVHSIADLPSLEEARACEKVLEKSRRCFVGSSDGGGAAVAAAVGDVSLGPSRRRAWETAQVKSFRQCVAQSKAHVERADSQDDLEQVLPACCDQDEAMAREPGNDCKAVVGAAATTGGLPEVARPAFLGGRRDADFLADLLRTPRGVEGERDYEHDDFPEEEDQADDPCFYVSYASEAESVSTSGLNSAVATPRGL